MIKVCQILSSRDSGSVFFCWLPIIIKYCVFLPFVKMADTSSNGPIEIITMACDDKGCDFKPKRMQRRAPTDMDVVIDMKYCGVCHTDLHTAMGHLSLLDKTCYPCVPGHELAGVCTFVGSKVTKFKIGDKVGVGCMVDSCMECAACKRGEEQMCTKQTATYNDHPGKGGRSDSSPAGSRTLGGYSTQMVVHEHYGILIPNELPLEYCGPIMCAGVTLYDPLIRYGAGPGTKVAVIGLGGLGIMGIKLATAMGCIVTAVSSTNSKEQLAKDIGAHSFINSDGGRSIPSEHKRKFDLVLNTVPIEHDYTVYSTLLNSAGKQIILGLNTALVGGFIVNAVTCGASRIKGSGIGSIKATQDVINFCAKHNIKPEIEVVPATELNKVYEALESSNVTGKRYVLDIATVNEDLFSRYTSGPVPPAPKLTSTSLGLTGGGILATFCDMLCCCRWC